jgi:hypothetical protein
MEYLKLSNVFQMARGVGYMGSIKPVLFTKVTIAA